MTEVRFYHLQKQTLDQALPLILEKVYQTGKNAVVRMIDEKEVNRMNDHLWAYRPDSFLPHACQKDCKKGDISSTQPIWLSANDDNPNNAKTLILTQGRTEEALENYDLACEMLDGRNNEAVQNARARWKTYKEKGFAVTYWFQSETGKWEKKA